MNCKTIVYCLSAMGLTAARLLAATSTSEFTYQGRLLDRGSPATGLYDLTFRLFDAVATGNPASDYVTNLNVGVSNGLFLARLDFGSSPFNGTAYWLEIGVRTNNGGSFNVLTPRQPLSPSPYALYAATAGTAGTAAVAAGLASNIVSTVNLQDGAVTAVKIGGGQVVKSLNGLRDDVILNTGGALELTTHGSLLTLSAPAWSLKGNAVATLNNPVLGTTDQQPLNLMVNNIQAMRLEPPPYGLSPNLIGGYGSVSPGAFGATIAGGGETNLPNSLYEVFTFIGGGRGNLIDLGSWDAAIVGGYYNLVDTNAVSGVIGGGEFNTLSGGAQYATIAGGSSGIVGQDSVAAVIGGGYLNANRANYAVVAGGATNEIGVGADGAVIGGGLYNYIADNSHSSTIGGGRDHTITDVYRGTISGGEYNALDSLADYSTVGGGFDNWVQAGAAYATIPGGRGATAQNYGQQAYASGMTSSYGDAQTSLYVLRRASTNTATTELFLDGVAERMNIGTNMTWTFQVLIVGTTSTGQSACYEYRGGIKNTAGNVSFVGGGSVASALAVASDLAGLTPPKIMADNTNKALTINATGSSGLVIRWVARVQTVEVRFM